MTNYLCLAFMAGILVVMWLTPDTRISVALIPVWLFVLWCFHLLRKKLPESAAVALPAKAD